MRKSTNQQGRCMPKRCRETRLSLKRKHRRDSTDEKCAHPRGCIAAYSVACAERSHFPRDAAQKEIRKPAAARWRRADRPHVARAIQDVGYAPPNRGRTNRMLPDTRSTLSRRRLRSQCHACPHTAPVHRLRNRHSPNKPLRAPQCAGSPRHLAAFFHVHLTWRSRLR